MASMGCALLLASCAWTQTASSRGTISWWNSWRGPDGTGAARDGHPPVSWSETKNVRWKVAIPGSGHSVPIIWQDRVYLTAAIETDRDGASVGQPPASPDGLSDRRYSRHPPPSHLWDFVVMALDRRDGKLLWRRKVAEVVPREGGQTNNTQASGSPLTDGEHIFAFFGSQGLYCLDLSGKVIWSKHLGQMQTRFHYGEGASPALFGNTLVVNWDHEGDSFIVALDKRTGRELWREARDEITTWGTPVIADVAGRPQVITVGTHASRAYDLQSGKLVWTCTGMTTNCIPSPIQSRGVVYLMSGFHGTIIQAIRLEGARGDLSQGKNRVWTHNRSTSYVPSALLYGNYLYFLRGNSGVLSCLDVRSGKVLFEGQRLRGLRSIYASPVGAGGHVYVTSRQGLTRVLAQGPEFREVASNQLDDAFDASAAVAGDELYLRGRKFLYCIAQPR